MEEEEGNYTLGVLTKQLLSRLDLPQPTGAECGAISTKQSDNLIKVFRRAVETCML